MSDRFYRVLDDSRFNRVLLPDRIQFEKVRFQGVKRGSKAQKSANFQYVFGSLLSVYTVPAVTLKVTAVAVALALGEIGPQYWKSARFDIPKSSICPFFFIFE